MKCQKLLLPSNTWPLGCLRSLIISGRERVSQGRLSNSIRRTRYWKREHLPAWRLSATHNHFPIYPQEKKKIILAGPVNCQSKKSERWDQSEKYALYCCWTGPNKHHEGPTGASFTPCGFTPWPATPAFMFHINIGRNDTLGEHGCYYGLPTTQRSSAQKKGDTAFTKTKMTGAISSLHFYSELAVESGESHLCGFTRAEQTRGD